MYLTIVEDASCRLLIMLGDGLRCMVLGGKVFSQRIDPMLLQEIFQTPFSNKNKKRKEKPTGRWHARNTHVTQTGSSRIFKRMVPVDYSYQSKRSIRNLSFYLSSNSLASFLSQTSNLVNSSHHLVTQVYQPRPVSTLSRSCQSSKAIFLFWSSEDKW